MRINIIAAVGKNLELGKDNKLIWNLKDDLKYFKEKTLGKTVVMGDNTYYSIGRLLPGRDNVILSLNDIEVDGALVLNDYKKVFSLDVDEVFIIGGSVIYNLFLPYADNIYLTEIEEEDNSADVYFPKFDTSLYDKEIIKLLDENNIKYSFVCYSKK